MKYFLIVLLSIFIGSCVHEPKKSEAIATKQLSSDAEAKQIENQDLEIEKHMDDVAQAIKRLATTIQKRTDEDFKEGSTKLKVQLKEIASDIDEKSKEMSDKSKESFSNLLEKLSDSIDSMADVLEDNDKK